VIQTVRPTADLGTEKAKESAICALLRIENCISTAFSRFAHFVAGGKVLNKEHSRFLLKMRVTGNSETLVPLTRLDSVKTRNAAIEIFNDKEISDHILRKLPSE
jgi:hypothetical protein